MAGRSKEEARTTATSPTRPGAGRAGREWVEQLRATLPELPSAKRRRLKGAEWNLTGARSMQALVNANAVDLVEADCRARALRPADALQMVVERPVAAGHGDRCRGLSELAVTPAQVARIVALVAAGVLNDKLARQVVDGVVAGEGDPDEVVAARGLQCGGDRGGAGRDRRPRSPPTRTPRKVRGGKIAAVGALVGAVMRATRGQADAGRVRELVLERLGVSG